MDYSSAKSAAIGQTANRVDVPELGRIKSAASRVAMARERVDAFLDRFNGAGPEQGDDTALPPSTYRNDLESLFEQIERLERVVNSLASIG